MEKRQRAHSRPAYTPNPARQALWLSRSPISALQCPSGQDRRLQESLEDTSSRDLSNHPGGPWSKPPAKGSIEERHDKHNAGELDTTPKCNNIIHIVRWKEDPSTDYTVQPDPYFFSVSCAEKISSSLISYLADLRAEMFFWNCWLSASKSGAGTGQNSP